MNKGFPNKFLGFPIGWKKMGCVRTRNTIENGEQIQQTLIHEFCKNILHIGKQDNIPFLYCPICMVKIDED